MPRGATECQSRPDGTRRWATLCPMSTRLSSRRYALLVDQLGDELGRAYGWQSRVARRLGIDQSTINRLVRRERATVGSDAIDRAVLRLRIDSRFFYDASLGDDPDYRDYAKGRMRMDAIEQMVTTYLDTEGAGLPEPVKGQLRMLWIDGIEVTPEIVRAIAAQLVLRHVSGEAPDERTRIVEVPGGKR